MFTILKLPCTYAIWGDISLHACILHLPSDMKYLCVLMKHLPILYADSSKYIFIYNYTDNWYGISHLPVISLAIGSSATIHFASPHRPHMSPPTHPLMDCCLVKVIVALSCVQVLFMIFICVRC